MSILLSVIAFAMAFGALWFTSEIARRTDARGKLMIKPHLAQVTAALKRADEKIHDLSRALEKAEREIKTLKALRLADLETDLTTPHTLSRSRLHGLGLQTDQPENTLQFRPTGTDD